MFTKYSDNLFADNIHVIIAVFTLTVTFYHVVYWALHSWITRYSYTQWNQNTNSTMKHFIELTDAKRYMYIEYITSLINATICSLLVPPVLLLCTPPPESAQNDLFMGNTYLRNEWCMDHANVYEALGISYFIGYLVFDSYVATCLLDNLYTSNGLQNIAHHAVCFTSCIGTLYSQKYMLTTGHLT